MRLTCMVAIAMGGGRGSSLRKARRVWTLSPWRVSGESLPLSVLESNTGEQVGKP